MQHQQFNASSESLPPPPAYLLDRNHQPHIVTNANSHYMTSSTSMGQMPSSNSAYSVTGNGKTHNELRQSSGVMRRQLSLINNHHPSSNHSQNSHVIIFGSTRLSAFTLLSFFTFLISREDIFHCLSFEFKLYFYRRRFSLSSRNEEHLTLLHVTCSNFCLSLSSVNL